jgi:hypothetical protein
MGLNEKITTRFEMIAECSRQDIVTAIASGKKNGYVANIFVADAVDYNEISLSDNKIEINRRPILLDAFRSSGTITIDMVTSSDNKTILKCEILPFHGNLPIVIALGSIGLIFWTLLVFAFQRTLYATIFVLISWTMIASMCIIVYLLTKYGLINYAKRAIKELTRDNKTSR